MTIAAAILAGLVAQAPPAAMPPTECPRVSLTYSGGLGFEDRGGVVFAAWDSGTLLRAVRFDEPHKTHVIGAVSASEVAALVEAVKASAYWDGQALLAIDVGEYTLELLRPDGSRLGRSQSRDERLSPALEAIRRRVFGLTLSEPRRVTGVVDARFWRCPSTIWTDE